MPDGPQTEPRHTLRLAVAHLSAATTIFLAGVAAVNHGWVIWGLILMVVAVSYLIYELVTSKLIVQNVPGMFRLLIAIFALTVVVGLNKGRIHRVFNPEPAELSQDQRLKIYVTTHLGVPTKDEAGSIQWRPEFTYIFLRVSNPGPFDYYNLDIGFRFDIGLAGMDQLTHFSGVSIFPQPSGLTVLDNTLQLTYPDGKKMTIHVPKRGGLTVTSTYRMRCDVVPARSDIELIAAGAVPNPIGSHDQAAGYPLAPRRMPIGLQAFGMYKAGGAPAVFDYHFPLTSPPGDPTVRTGENR